MEKSTELRLWDMLYRAHTGSTSDMVEIAVSLDMEIELQRSYAAETVGQLLITKLSQEGYLTVDGIKDTLETWHEHEI